MIVVGTKGDRIIGSLLIHIVERSLDTLACMIWGQGVEAGCDATTYVVPTIQQTTQQQTTYMVPVAQTALNGTKL